MLDNKSLATGHEPQALPIIFSGGGASVVPGSSEATGATMNLGLALIQAATFAGDDEPERAVTLAAAGLAHFGMEMAPFQRRMLDPVLDRARDRLGDDRYQELFRIGNAMSPAEAAARSVRAARPSPPDSTSP